MVNISDKSLLMFFLRANLIDPRNRITQDSNQAITLTSETIVSVVSSNSVSHINNVIIDGTPLTAFVDYLYDTNNRKIIFIKEQTGALTYDTFTGKAWIYADKPRKNDLKDDSFPRVQIMYVSRPITKLGNFESTKVINNRIQIDVWVKKDYVATINLGDYTSKEADDKLALNIAESISKVFDDKARELTTNHFIDFVPIDEPKIKDYVEETGLYNSMFEFFIKSVK